MSGRCALLFDRGELFTLVEQLVGLALEDDRHPRDRRKGTPPAVLATGGRGAGKTAALEAVERAYSKRVPRVLVNLAEERFAGTGGAPADEPLLVLLRELKWRLEYEVRDNGRLRFPRLSIGLLVIQTWKPGWRPGSTMTLQEARQKLDRELDLVTRLAHPDPGEDGAGEEGGRHEERAAAWVADVLGDFGGSLAQYPVDIFVRATVSAFVEWTLPGLGRTLTGVARRLTRQHPSTPLRWWAECDPDASGGWVEALINLALNWHLGGDYRARAERELVKALLADAGAEYTGTAGLTRAGRPLALLDNLGGAPMGHRPAGGQDAAARPAAGRRFLELVLDCRTEPRAGADPVVIIATESAAFRLEQEEAGTPYPAAALLRVPLTALDRDDAHRLLAGADPWRLPADLGRLVHRLTGGLPLGVDVITRAVVRAAPGGPARPPGAAAVTAAGLLGLPAARDRGDGGDRSVAGRLLRQLVPDDGWRSHLVLLSAARDAAEAQALVTAHVPQDQDHSLVPNAERLLADNGWAGPALPSAARLDPARPDAARPGPRGGDGYFVADAFVRTLLLHQLSSPGAAVSAVAAHTVLRDLYGPDGSGLLSAGEPARLYHCLARGDAGYVTGRLHASFADSPAQGWLEALVRVVAAPCAAYRDTSRRAALGRRDDSARDRLYRSISRLLHAGWYLTDPLVSPTGEGEVVAALRTELFFLAKEHPRGNRVLSRAALEWPARLLAWDQGYFPTPEGD
jgi:hypothetical protein